MIREIVFRLFILYKKHFPIERGKARVSDILTKVFGSFTLKSRYPFILEVYINSSQDLYLIDLVDDSVIREIKKLKKGDTFIDVGANIGFYSLAASEYVGENGKVISIEPSIREYMRLLKNINYNNVNNVTPFNFIISDRNDIIPFNIADKHTGLNRISIKRENNETVMLPSFKLDSIASLLDIKRIDLLKIDVEGAEMMVINGMRNLLEKKMVDKIILEITPRFLLEYGHNKETIYQTLNEYGYTASVNSSEWQYDEIFKLK